MAGEWREYTIGEIAKIVGGSTPPTADPSNFNGNIPWLTPKDLSNFTGRYISRGERNISRKGLMNCSAKLLPPGTVLLTSRAPIGYIAIAKTPLATNQGFRNLILKPGFIPEFVYYWLKANVDELKRHASGSTFRELSGSALKQIRIRIPDTSEQRAIAHILGTLDDKIELLRRMSETLEAMARAIFKAWFVDFVPVRAKMEGRWKRGQSLPGLPAHLYDLFPNRLVPSELGEIPEGWEVQQFDDIVTQVREAVSPFDFPNSIFKLFSIPAFDRGKWPYIEIGANIKSQKWKVPPNTVLLSKLNPEIERVWIVDTLSDENAICSTEFMVLQPRHPYGTAYVYSLIRSSAFRGILKSLVTGTSKSHQRVRTSEVLKIPVLKPRQAQVLAFEQISTPFLKRTLQARREAYTLTALRDALLPKLIRGEIRVRSTERFTEAKGI